MVIIQYAIINGRFYVKPGAGLEPSIAEKKNGWYLFHTEDNISENPIIINTGSGLLNAIYTASGYCSSDKLNYNRINAIISNNIITISGNSANVDRPIRILIRENDLSADLLCKTRNINTAIGLFKRYMKLVDSHIDYEYHVNISDMVCDRNIVAGDIVKHFKRELVEDKQMYIYKVVSFAISTDTGKKVVIYEAMYNDEAHDVYVGKQFVRSFNEFMGLVDRKKYPNICQTYRFELL